MIASPTLTSAAATTIIKKTNICASAPPTVTPPGGVAIFCIFEKATNKRFTAFNINSTHIKMMIAFLRVSTPATPIQKSVEAKMI